MLTNDLLIGHVSTSIVRDLRMRVFDSALAMDRKTYQAYGTSGLLAAITAAADGLTAGLIHLFGAAIREPLRIASCLIMASLINWRLLLLSLVLAPALVAIVVFFNRKIRRAAASILGRNAGFHEVLLEALGNIFTVQAFTMEPHERDRFRICTNEMKRVQLKMVFWTGIGKPFTEMIGVAMVAITVCAGAYLVVNKQTHLFFLKVCDSPMSVTDLLIFFGLLIGASDPLRKLSGVSVMIYQGMVSSELLYGILNAKPILPVPAEPKTLLGRHHQLSLKNVSFHYHPSQPVLSNVSLEIPFGKTVALLGSNGSGKSTLIQLLCRYYDPVAGSIQLDDVDLRDLALSDIRQRMTLVSQNTELFNRSVFENI
jgi:ATP-binding cassette subfamily B protein/subfamily B ATP-binding cassette protein MsbA